MRYHLNQSSNRKTSDVAVPLVDIAPRDSSYGYSIRDASSDRRTNWSLRFGILGLITLLLGSVAILSILIFLAIIWQQSLLAIEGQDVAPFWHHIATNGWATKIVTISTAVIRTVMGTQAGIFTSMISALILEKIGVSILDVPFLSMSRAFQTQPHNLLSHITFRRRNFKSTMVYSLAIIEVMITISSQFLSTLLISDFGNTAVSNLPNSTTVRSTYRTDVLFRESYIAEPPAAHWRFAEYSEPFTGGDDFHDTGHTYRAFLPYEDEVQRTSLRGYRGPADIFDFRVVCVRPSLNNLVFSQTEGIYVFSGTMTVNGSYPMLNAQPTIGFVCPISRPLFVLNGTTIRLTTMCNLNRDRIPILNDPLNDPWTTIFIALDFIREDMTTFLVPGANQTAIKVVRTDGPWAIGVDEQGEDLVRATACYMNQGWKVQSVQMHSSRDMLEPRMPWKRELRAYDTANSRHQLGASLEPASTRDRGVLDLNHPADWQEIDEIEWIVSSPYNEKYHADYFNNMMGGLTTLVNSTVTNLGFTLSNATAGSNTVHLSHVALYQDTLHVTESPSLAMQAFFTRLSQMAYYDLLRMSALSGEASTIFSSTVLIPIRWNGFIGATIIIAVHLCVIATAAVSFLLYTDKSDLGNIWQALSQIVTHDALLILKRLGRLRDNEVEKIGQAQFPELAGDVILRREEDGEITLRAKY